MPDCPVAALLAAAAEPAVRRLAADLRAGPDPPPGSAAAAAHYRGVAAALVTAGELAARPGGDGLAALLRGDEMATARMQLAAAVLGPAVTATVTGPDTLALAIGWQRFANGPATPLAAACAADIVRGLLRQWVRGGSPRRTRLARARVLLLGQARSACAALRAEGHREIARTTPRRSRAVRDSLELRARQAADRLRHAADWELGDDGAAGIPIAVDPPPVRAMRAEHRLTLLLGVGFGAGAALSLTRVLGDLIGGPNSLLTVAAGLLGLAAGGWLARTRRTLVERAASERWVAEFTATLRAAMEEYVALRVLAAAGPTADSQSGPPRR